MPQNAKENSQNTIDTSQSTLTMPQNTMDIPQSTVGIPPQSHDQTTDVASVSDLGSSEQSSLPIKTESPVNESMETIDLNIALASNVYLLKNSHTYESIAIPMEFTVPLLAELLTKNGHDVRYLVLEDKVRCFNNVDMNVYSDT